MIMCKHIKSEEMWSKKSLSQKKCDRKILFTNKFDNKVPISATRRYPAFSSLSLLHYNVIETFPKIERLKIQTISLL